MKLLKPIRKLRLPRLDFRSPLLFEQQQQFFLLTAVADKVWKNCVGLDQCSGLVVKLTSLSPLRPDDPGLDETVGHSQSLLDLLTQFLSSIESVTDV